MRKILKSLALLYLCCGLLIGCSTETTDNTPTVSTMHSITITQGITNGTVISSKTTAAGGETVSLTITPNTGYQLGTLTVMAEDGTNVPVSGNAFIMPPKNVVVNATFTALPPRVYAVNVTNGTANPSRGSQGTLITLTANTPATGKEFDTWATNTSGVTFANANSASTTFTMPARNVNISATYKNKNYSITKGSCSNGLIQVGAVTSIYEAIVSVRLIPDDSCEWASLSVITESGTEILISNNTNKSQGEGAFSFRMPADNVRINATFIKYYTFESTPYREIGTTTLNGTSYKLVEFGDYPQTVKAANVTVDELQGARNLPYYKGSDDAWYAKIAENAFDNGYTYSDGTVIGQGGTNYKWFKVQPIKWRVLTERYDYYHNTRDKIFLLAENILAANYFSNRKGFESYYQSSIHSWLYRFETQACICYKLDEDYAPINQTLFYHSGTEPKLKYFLVRADTVSSASYGFSEQKYYIGDTYGTTSSSRIREATDYAKACGVPLVTSNSSAGKYWLNDTDMNIAYYVSGNGKIENTDVTNVLGVVPAVFVKK